MKVCEVHEIACVHVSRRVCEHESVHENMFVCSMGGVGGQCLKLCSWWGQRTLSQETSGGDQV